MHALNMHTFTLNLSTIVFFHDVCVLVLVRGFSYPVKQHENKASL